MWWWPRLVHLGVGAGGDRGTDRLCVSKVSHWEWHKVEHRRQDYLTLRSKNKKQTVTGQTMLTLSSWEFQRTNQKKPQLIYNSKKIISVTQCSLGEHSEYHNKSAKSIYQSSMDLGKEEATIYLQETQKPSLLFPIIVLDKVPQYFVGNYQTWFLFRNFKIRWRHFCKEEEYLDS